MRPSIIPLLCITLLFISQISANPTTAEPKVAEVILIRRADQATSSHGDHGGSSNSSSNSTTTTTMTTTNTTTATKGNTLIWASPAILENGTLFYVAISISTLLWCTGKAVDMSIDQQERRAEFMSRR